MPVTVPTVPIGAAQQAGRREDGHSPLLARVEFAAEVVGAADEVHLDRT